MNNDELLEALESVANFMRGMGLDPRIPHDTKEAVKVRASDIDDLVGKYLENDNA
ncbi:hypothetical protein [Acinetobacter guillouiae]|uniref:hypothetical protein n=1 Tax=Acinetobacter guillouiae TaxID=106649 RepID=UPI0028EEBC11|nr:hypothetical protein [Acinetobacter guillouiae]